jgi:ATP-dependent RNA helicase DeaD
MLAALKKAAYDEPTPVQAGIIPRALDGGDVLGQARTGTGKTAAFAIPILEQLKHGRKGSPPQALVLVPTRELAVQVRDEFEKLAHGRRISSVPIYGGKPIKGQINKLQAGADVVIGTPGRVIDLIGRGALDLRSIQIVVLDEADRMLDIGFRPDIEKILRRCPRDRQTLLLSATVAPPVERLARTYMHEPEVMDFSPKTKAVDTIEQFYFTVDQERKFELLTRLLKRDGPEQAIVFCRTKRGTERIYRRLVKHFPGTDMMHGDMVQGARDRVMKAFRAGDVRILVATDVVGRGIDVSGISHIINYDIPQSSDDYVHRVGRTGRMGREGVAYTFVTTEEGGELTRIEMLINRLLKRDEIEGFMAVESAAPPIGSSIGSSDGEQEDAPPSPPKPTPPGRRPPKRHRRAL